MGDQHVTPSAGDEQARGEPDPLLVDDESTGLAGIVSKKMDSGPPGVEDEIRASIWMGQLTRLECLKP